MIAQPGVRRKILNSGAEIIGGTRRQMADLCAEDPNRLAPVVRKANIKLD